jgi:hypothetical protein
MIRRRIEEAQALDAVVRDDAPGRHSQQQESQPLPSLLDFSLPPLLFDNDGEEKYTEEEKEWYEKEDNDEPPLAPVAPVASGRSSTLMPSTSPLSTTVASMMASTYPLDIDSPVSPASRSGSFGRPEEGRVQEEYDASGGMLADADKVIADLADWRRRQQEETARALAETNSYCCLYYYYNDGGGGVRFSGSGGGGRHGGDYLPGAEARLESRGEGAAEGRQSTRRTRTRTRTRTRSEASHRGGGSSEKRVEEGDSEDSSEQDDEEKGRTEGAEKATDDDDEEAAVAVRKHRSLYSAAEEALASSRSDCDRVAASIQRCSATYVADAYDNKCTTSGDSNAVAAFAAAAGFGGPNSKFDGAATPEAKERGNSDDLWWQHHSNSNDGNNRRSNSDSDGIMKLHVQHVMAEAASASREAAQQQEEALCKEVHYDINTNKHQEKRKPKYKPPCILKIKRNMTIHNDNHNNLTLSVW